MLRILIRNIVSNWVGFAVQVAVTFFLTPFVLHALGDTRYGIWALVTGLTGYYGLLDLGFRSGITQYLTRHLAARDFEAMNATASTAMVALASCGGLIVVASSVVSWLAPAIFNIPADAVMEMRLCIIVIGISTAAQFVFFPYSAVFAATQRYDMSNVIGVSTRLATAGATVLALRSGYGLLGLCLVNAAGDLLGYTLRVQVACRILPQLRISPRLASRQRLWPIATFGVWSLLINGAQQLKSYASTIVIGLFMPVAAIAPYVLAAGLVGYLDAALTPIAIVFFPAITHLDTRGEIQAIRKVYLLGSRMMLLLAMAAGLVAAFWAGDFFQLWIGAKFTEQAEYTSVTVLFRFLLPATIVTLAQRIGNQVLYGTRRLKRIGALLASEAIVYLALTVCLIRPFGLVGVAVSAVISALIFQAVVHPIMVCRAIGVSARSYLGNVYMRPLAGGVVLAGMLLTARPLCPTITTWPQLLMLGALTGVVAATPIVFIGLDRAERERLITGPLMQMYRRLGLQKPT